VLLGQFLLMLRQQRQFVVWPEQYLLALVH
jgi:hypothetical protein